MRRRSSRASKKKCTQTAYASENTAGISVCVGKESTLKETQTCNCCRKYILCNDFSLRTFGTDLVRLLVNKKCGLLQKKCLDVMKS